MLPSGLPEAIAPEEDLARFIVQSRHFSIDRVKPAAFLPSPNDQETSVSRHGSEPRTNLWALGRTAAGNRSLYGAAILKARSVRDHHLDVESDEPPPRHAIICGWPHSDDPEIRKAKCMNLAQGLAIAAGPPILRVDTE